MKFRKVWNDETNNFLIAHKDLCRPNGGYDELLKIFNEAYPGANVGRNGLKTQCSRLGITKRKHPHGATKALPLYSEHYKKGYVRIKIAQPSVWVSKAKWVYMETHPWEDCSERSNYIFLDGNNRNFHPNNIERVKIKYMGIFNGMGGTAETPELTRLRVLQAKLKYGQLEAGEKLGLVVNCGAGRRFREDVNREARERSKKLTPEQRKRRAKRAYQRIMERRRQDPAFDEKYKAYQREYAKRNRNNSSV